ncbi:aminotransferase class III-fold pyridoxal phosphate-dependent enzyme, partial [Ligilactobacillus pobuzihii]
ATLDVIEDEHLVERSARLGKIAEDFFAKEKEKYSFIGEVRMYGLDGGIDIVDPQTGGPDRQATTKVIYRMFELGVLIISLKDNVLRFQPPLVITDEQLDQAFKVMDQAFKDLQDDKLSLPENAANIGW